MFWTSALMDFIFIKPYESSYLYSHFTDEETERLSNKHEVTQ